MILFNGCKKNSPTAPTVNVTISVVQQSSGSSTFYLIPNKESGGVVFSNITASSPEGPLYVEPSYYHYLYTSMDICSITVQGAIGFAEKWTFVIAGNIGGEKGTAFSVTSSCLVK